MLIFRRHSIVEAKDSVDRLHVLVEQCYKDMSSRIQALEVLDVQQKSDAEWLSGDDTESLRTIHAHPPELSSEEPIEDDTVPFDFSNELQRSRVYRRNQAFRISVISALTNSVYSLGWSFFSDMSMAEVSNISVINLAITEGETFNPHRLIQTWSANPNERVSNGNRKDGEHIQQETSVGVPAPTNESASTRRANTQTQQQILSESRTVPPVRPVENPPTIPQLQEHYGKQTNAEATEDPALTSILPLKELLDPSSPSQVQLTSSTPSHESAMEDEAVYPCKGCGEVCSTWLCCLSAKLVTRPKC